MCSVLVEGSSGRYVWPWVPGSKDVMCSVLVEGSSGWYVWPWVPGSKDMCSVLV